MSCNCNGKNAAQRRAPRDPANPPSKMSVRRPSDPPPPPPPPPLLEGGEGVEGGGGADPPIPGVGPEVTGVAQAAVPADAGAVLLARFGSTRISAESTRLWSSVTVKRSVNAVKAGAITEALAVLAPLMAGGLLAGDTTVHA